MAPKHGKRKKKWEDRPKLQPIESVSKNNSSDELWDGVLTRPRSIDELNINEGINFSAKQVSTGAVLNAGVNDLMEANELSTTLGCDTESSLHLHVAADKETSATAQSEPMIIPPNIHRNKAAAASTTMEPLSPDKLSPPTENVSSAYASKYITSDDTPHQYSTLLMMSSISPPRTPECSSLKCPEIDNQTPDTVTTDSTAKIEEYTELLDHQQQLALDNNMHDDLIDITSTPVVSNMTIAAGESTKTVLKQQTQSRKSANNSDSPMHQRSKTKRKKRLQPRSTLFSPGQPKTPDEDMYNAFGFNLHKHCSEGRQEKTLSVVESSVVQKVKKDFVEEKMDEEGAAIVSNRTTTNDSETDVYLDETSPSRRTSSLSLNVESLILGDDREHSNGSQIPIKKTRRTSSVSFSDNPNHSNTSLNTSTVHLIGSRSGEKSKRGDDDDYDADSISTSESDDDISYFNELNDDQHAGMHHSAKVDLPRLPQLPMRTTHATSFTDDHIELPLSLSLSEDEDYCASYQEELVLYHTYNPTKGDSFGSSLVESASESEQEDDVEEEKSPRPMSNNSFTSGSDDAGVVNELSSYHLSSKINAMNIQSSSPTFDCVIHKEGVPAIALSKSTTPPGKSFNSETPTPTHAEGAKYIYDNVQSAVVDVKANSGAHKPTSSIDNSVGTSISSLQQHSVKERSPAKVKQMHSSGGAFTSTPRRRKEVSTALDSLAYSDDRQDNVFRYESTEDVTPFRHMKEEFDEEMIASMTVCQNNHHGDLSSRWSVLFTIFVLNLMAGWTCFSAAPISSIVKDAFNDTAPTYLVSVFLLASCVGCVIEPVLRCRIGLRKTIMLGALLLMVGNLVKSGGGPLFHLDGAGWRLSSGFFAVGISHPFYQNTVSIVIDDWFPEIENRLVTNIALNSFQIGIILSFMFGTMVVNSQDDLDDYFQLMSLISVMAFILVSFLVEDAPTNRSPLSQYQSRNFSDKKWSRENAKTESNPLLSIQPLPQIISSPMVEQYQSIECKSTLSLPHSTTLPSRNLDADMLSLVRMCFSFSGFSHCTIAYVASGMVINTIITFIGDFIETPKLDIMIVGATFQLITIISACIFEKFTDQSRIIYRLILTLLVLGAASLLLCSLQLHEHVMLVFNICILAVGFLVGPVMQLCTVLGSKVTHSLSDNDVLIVQRFISNGISGASLPIFSLLHNYSVETVGLHAFTPSFYFLIAAMSSSAVCFSFFKNPSLFYEEEFQISVARPTNGIMRYQHWMPSGNMILTN